MSELGVFEVIRTARALRRFKPDPVPPALITQILEAAICAPSGGNIQDWYFLVITDPEQRKRIAEIYAEASRSVRPFYENRLRPEHMTETEERHLRSAGFHLHEHLDEAPVLLLVCGRSRVPPRHHEYRSRRFGETRSLHHFRQHLSGCAEYNPGVPGTRSCNCAHDESRIMRGGDQIHSWHSGGGGYLRADADRLSTRQVWSGAAQAAQRSRNARSLGRPVVLS